MIMHFLDSKDKTIKKKERRRRGSLVELCKVQAVSSLAIGITLPKVRSILTAVIYRSQISSNINKIET